MSSAAGKAEARLRLEVAVCTRILNVEGLLGYSGHVSARLPGSDTFLIQPVDTPRGEVEPDGLIEADLDGRRIAGPEDRPPSEVFIHAEILKARPDVNAVAHFHADAAVIFTLVDGVTLSPLKNHAIRWADGIPVHPDPGHVNTPERGRALAATLGRHHALLIRAHGVVVAAESVAAVLMDSIHFVENAEAWRQAAQLGAVKPLTAGEMAAFGKQLDRARHAPKLWAYYVGRAVRAGVVPSAWAQSLSA